MPSAFAESEALRRRALDRAQKYAAALMSIASTPVAEQHADAANMRKIALEALAPWEPSPQPAQEQTA